MHTDLQKAQDPGVAKISALLLAARADLTAGARELALAFREPLHAPGDTVPDRSPAITRLMEQLRKLHTDVHSVTVVGAAAENARDLTASALLETIQALGTLAESYAAPDQQSATTLLAKSVGLLKEANATSAKAGKALNIPWPLQ
jgi:hypothetical protein